MRLALVLVLASIIASPAVARQPQEESSQGAPLPVDGSSLRHTPALPQVGEPPSKHGFAQRSGPVLFDARVSTAIPGRTPAHEPRGKASGERVSRPVPLQRGVEAGTTEYSQPLDCGW